MLFSCTFLSRSIERAQDRGWSLTLRIHETGENFKMIKALLTRRSNIVSAFLGFAILGFAVCGYAQQQPGIKGEYLTVDGKPAFLTGANYIPSTGWLMILENWNPSAVDRDMAALHKLGVTSVRFPPLWPLLEPAIDKVDAEKLDRINELVNIAHRNGISVTVGPITGWMSGATFIPKWADGNIFTDEKIVRGEQTLEAAVAHRLKNNPGLLGYDFGNEISAMAGMMHLDPTPEETDKWMAAIYGAFHEADPTHPVTNGLGGFGGSFDITSVGEHSDYMSVHYYPYFTATLHEDPWIGQRTTYGVDYLVAYAAMTGKPVLVQEIGCSENWVPVSEIGKFMRLTLMSSWAQGAAGYFWWGSHNIDENYHPPANLMALKHSMESFKVGRFSDLEYSMGLLDTANHPKPYSLEYAHWNAVIGKLGVGWKNELPVAYLIFPEHVEDRATRSTEMTAFTLAKQAHMDVRMLAEGKAVPADAAAVVIPGFSLSDKGKAAVRAYLEKGGTVYQSYASDFSEAITTKDSGGRASSPVLIGGQAAGLFSIAEHLRVHGDVKLMDAAPAADAKVELLLGIPEENGEASRNDEEEHLRGVLFKASVGKGTYYYLAANLEEALAKTYNPWGDDDSNLIYSVIRPEGGVDIDSKYVELVEKSRGNERLYLLLNHSNRPQDVTFRSAGAIRLEDYTSHAALGAGKEIPIHLMPGEVLVAEPQGLAGAQSR